MDHLQQVLNQFVCYDNHYRLHSVLAWDKPATRYIACAIAVTGLAQLLALQAMTANPAYSLSHADPPIPISPFTDLRFRALIPTSSSD